ncbi:rhomboid family intramembrane serine protease [Luteolibacter arcticus]|uniref:Rhomboid family intramembrane serine protease n=1 Tax=Luteolibacter arcticus TaxID=1581411 RepID=A0ABT3GNX9_9BACT|nr:rhomboid family intramembrane serine protease [Luteolibacter arcticus]MCW1925229.1 rhomboid family intramembrane serine protease [Luteolibacter arcticus]
MGASDRDYFRDEERRYAGGGALPGLTPVTKWLLIANAVIFLIDFFSRSGKGINAFFGVINEPLCFSIESAFLEGRIWELLTFQFLHANPWHLIGNCVGLYVFGPWAERWWGSRRFLVFYLLCGVAGALFFTLLTLTGALPGRDLMSPLVGASAGIYGIFLSIAVIDPKERVRLLFPPVELTMRKLALIAMGIAVVIILVDNLVGGRPSLNSGGEAGHLGGAILGYLLTRFPQILRKGKGTEEKIIRPKEFRRRRQVPKLRPRTAVDIATASDVDRILDKISRDGIQSLTDSERETLNKASKPTKER